MNTNILKNKKYKNNFHEAKTDLSFVLERLLFATYIKIIHRKYNLRFLTSGPPCKELRCCYSIIATSKKLKKRN